MSYNITVSDSDHFHGNGDDTVNGMVDFSGWPAKRSQTGFWRSAYFIIGVGTVERFAYYGIASNLITYLTGPLGQPTAAAAASINVWTGTGLLLPLFGAFVADSFLGRFRTIVCSSLVYIMALALLTTSALLNQEDNSSINSKSPSQLHLLFFVSLYLLALGQGMYKPCILAFGADQFDDQHPRELSSRSSYFNWWYCCIYAGPLAALVVLNYIQDNISWGIGFGIPCIAMAASLIIFILGTKKYRYNIKTSEKCAISRVCYVLVKAVKNCRVIPSSSASDEEMNDTVPQLHSQQFKFLNKALLAPDGSVGYGESCSMQEVEEAKALLNLIPICMTSLPFGIASAQPLTLFTEQGIMLDRSITPCFKLPAASLSYVIGISLIFLVPIYDRLFVPLSRLITRSRIPSGITKLQRIGTGMLICTLCMVTAALIEKKRLHTASKHGLADNPSATVPMSFLWIIPQYILFGLSQVFALVGLQETFYEQVPHDLKSVGLSLSMSIYGIGNLLSSSLICMIEKLTSEGGGTGWFSDDTNRAHLDYFYWLLAGLNAVGFLGFLYIARSSSV